jgi:copper chaperone CopZ
MKTLTLRIEGMHCEGCARTAEALVTHKPGVHEVKVNDRGGEARLAVDPDRVRAGHLALLIAQAGDRATEQ